MAMLKKFIASIFFLIGPTLAHGANLSNIYMSLENFVGRERSLDDVEKNFNSQKTIAITGPIGIGKTQFVRKYAYINRKKYNLTWWLDSERPLLEQYRELGTILLKEFPQDCLRKGVLEESPILFVNHYLKTTKKKWLLIFDN